MLRTMKRIPNTPHTLIRTLHRLRDPLQPLPARIPQQQHFFQNLIRLQISHADGFLAAVDVLASDYGVAAWSGGDGDFDLGVLAGEGLEVGFEEVAVMCQHGVGVDGGAIRAYFIPLLLPAQSQ